MVMTKQPSEQREPARHHEQTRSSERAGTLLSPPEYGIAFADAPVQRALATEGSPTRMPTADTRRLAEAGVRGSGGRLPHFETIQRAFGRHDVHHVQSYTSPAAASACRSIGARAYTTGNKVAFSGSPSLHTAAHEAAHTIQQRAGVQLEGGVGEAGDPYELQADAVADAVVRGASAQTLLDSLPQSSGGPTAPVQRTLYTLGQMNDDPNHLSPESLNDLIDSEEDLPAEFAQFLPALAASSEEIIFALGESGKVSMAEAKNVIVGAKDSFVVSGTSWSFVLPGTGSWQHMDHVTRTPGCTTLQYGDAWIVTLNLAYLPQITPTVLAAVKSLSVAERTPTATMTLATELAYRQLIRNTAQIREYGILGNVVLSVTPNLNDIGSPATVQTLKEWIIATFGAWEPMQMDPRHIGTHDGYNMGVAWHYHLIMAPGMTLGLADELLIMQQIWMLGALEESPKQKDARELAELARLRKEKQSSEENEKAVMALFMKAKGLSKPDMAKRAELIKANKSGPSAALTKWLEIKPGLEWKP